MNKRRIGPSPKLVWRISESTPLGEWVVAATTHPELLAAAKEVACGSSWASPSFDLLQGADVAEDGPDTLPGELYDEIFNADVDTAGQTSPATPLKR